MYSSFCHNDRNCHKSNACLYTKCRNETHALKSMSYAADRTGADNLNTAGAAAAERRTLNDILPGRHGFVTALLSSGDMRRRLLDIGLTPGTRVECLGKSPLGDPSAFLIRGAVIALRRKDCRDVLVAQDRKDCRTVLTGHDQNGSRHVLTSYDRKNCRHILTDYDRNGNRQPDPPISVQNKNQEG